MPRITQKQNPDASALFELIQFIRANTGGLFFKTALLLFFSSLTEGVSIVLLIPIIGLFAGDVEKLNINLQGSPLEDLVAMPLSFGLATLLTAFAVLVSARAALVYLTELSSARLVQDFTRRLRLSLFESVTAAKWAFLSLQRSADLDHTLTADVDRLERVVVTLLSLLRTIFTVLIYITISFIISWKLTILTGLLGGLLLIVLRPLRNRARAFGKSFTDNRREQFRVVNHFIDGMKTSKAYAAEQRYVENLGGSLTKISALTLNYVRITAAANMAVQIFSVLALTAFVYFSLARFNMSAAQTITMIVVYFRLAPRMLAFQSSMQELIANLGSMNAVLSLQAKCKENAEIDAACDETAPSLRDAIRFKHVSFGYARGEKILNDLSFSFPAGKITAIVGPTASGKSTLADLVMGLISPDQGDIFIDDLHLDDHNRRAWRKRIGYVPQDTAMLHDTIRANLLLGCDGAGDADISRALEMAHADAILARLPDGLETLAGDQGRFFSGGERQRLALARALLRKPDLLILDEATSALDWEHEAAITDALKELRGHMTVITITHRPAMARIADNIIALDKGAILEQGSVEDMLDLEDSYISRFFSLRSPAKAPFQH